jgi:predicted Zn-dependent protease
MTVSRRATIAAASLAGLLVGVGCAGPSPSVQEIDHRISYYQDRVRSEPRLYPGYALLGAAYLDKARCAHDPVWLARSREVLARSMEIQPNFDAMKTTAAVCNFSHRFEDALRWIDRAAGAMPEDTSLVAMRVEALLALGRVVEAQNAVTASELADDFYVAAARGQVAIAMGRLDDARVAFFDSAEAARAQKANQLQAWALVMAAGTLIDSGRAANAKRLLASARTLDPDSVDLAIHDAEVLEANGKPESALAKYADLANDSGDPGLHAKSFALAKKLSRRTDAAAHFKAAESGFQKAIDAAEVYTLEAMAMLYLEAGESIERARLLAEENYKYKQDRSAVELIERINAATNPPALSEDAAQ